MNLGDFNLRPALPSAEPALYEVCLKTGDGGQDATALYTDPRALGNIYVGPYLALEPSLAFALEDREGVCGYVLAARDSRKFYREFVEQWLPALRRSFPEPAGPPEPWTPTEKIYHAYYHPEIFCPEPYEAYPAHLHIDLRVRARGRGLGTAMIKTILARLTELKAAGVHLGMDPRNGPAERFYRRLGFEELARHEETLYLGRSLP